jgi:histidinol-phosphate aminotransferase
LRQTLDAIAVERTRLGAGLQAMRLTTFPSAANFVSAAMPAPAARIAAELERRGILVRDWRDPDHLSEIRITVGRPDDIDAVLDALREILSQRPE